MGATLAVSEANPDHLGNFGEVAYADKPTLEPTTAVLLRRRSALMDGIPADAAGLTR